MITDLWLWMSEDRYNTWVLIGSIIVTSCLTALSER